jgi:hypothetical protein
MRSALPCRRCARRCLAALACLFFVVFPARAQTEDDQTTAPPNGDDSPPVKDSSVGYIDSAVPFTHLRLRYDTAYDFTRPTRAEYFYPKGRPGPGLPRPETSVDYQEASAYLEIAFSEFFSVFAEAPWRILNPEVNNNTAGYSDTIAGAKFVFAEGCDWLATFQVKGYFPTGDADRGLGTNHFSVEPALLFQKCMAPWARLEGEFRYWIPIDGTDFAGSIIRYGLGLSLGHIDPEGFWFTPVVEFIGWTVLDGKELAAQTPTVFQILDASGDTIINSKVGVRAGLRQCLDVYAGWGHALTGETWYKDVFRVEMRVRF